MIVIDLCDCYRFVVISIVRKLQKKTSKHLHYTVDDENPAPVEIHRQSPVEISPKTLVNMADFSNSTGTTGFSAEFLLFKLRHLQRWGKSKLNSTSKKGHGLSSI